MVCVSHPYSPNSAIANVNVKRWFKLWSFVLMSDIRFSERDLQRKFMLAFLSFITWWRVPSPLRWCSSKVPTWKQRSDSPYTEKPLVLILACLSSQFIKIQFCSSAANANWGNPSIWCPKPLRGDLQGMSLDRKVHEKMLKMQKSRQRNHR